MNKIIKSVSLIAIMGSLAGGVFTVNAADTNAVTGTENRAATSTTKIDKAQERMQLLRNSAMRVENRFDVNIRTLDSLSSRIASRIGKMGQEGIDMTEAKAKLNEANIAIQSAKDAATALQQGIENAFSSTQPKVTFNKVRVQLVKDVMDKVKAAHKALVDTVTILMKVARPSDAATSTAESATGASTQNSNQ